MAIAIAHDARAPNLNNANTLHSEKSQAHLRHLNWLF
jgi:hypothetical protein